MTEKIEFNDINNPELENHIGDTLAEKLRADIELIEGVYPEFDVDTYLRGDIAPVFFGSALNNFGVKELLDCFIKIAPSPRPIQAVERVVEPEEDNFTGFIFKIHANMDPNHRSCIAFVKICSGRFERNAPYKHVRFGKQLRFSSPTAFMAQKKETAVVYSQEELAPGIFSMWIVTDIADEARPGQFISVYSQDGSRLLPRPISICEADPDEGRLRIVFLETRSTSWDLWEMVSRRRAKMYF